MRITEIETLQYFENEDYKTRHGVYKCKFNDTIRFFVIANDLVYVLTHYIDKADLSIVTESVALELFELLGLKKIKQ